MKKNIILFLSLLVVINVFGQYPINQPENKNYGYYYSKYKTQAATGKILCAGGTTLAVVGAVGVMRNFDLWGGNSVKNRRADVYSYIFLVGAVADIVSIPFFISAGANKRKASLTFNFQNGYLLKSSATAFNAQPVPSLTLSVKF
ncbi:hypothetical protein [Mariniphaga sp.]|uniref:hypothetical protein n=1 Tax=Mariniphaga sp. TaxID=1954475 RepID=UPI003563198A